MHLPPYLTISPYVTAYTEQRKDGREEMKQGSAGLVCSPPPTSAALGWAELPRCTKANFALVC